MSLRNWHLNSTCQEVKEFLEYKGNKILKRCPKCSIYTEKNLGCNHMTCTNYRFQWCWLCEKEYNYNHYSQGECNGLQFIRANNLNEAININLTIINNQNQNFNNNINEQNSFCCHEPDNILHQFEYIIKNFIYYNDRRKCRSFVVIILLHCFFGFLINSLKTMSDCNEVGFSNKKIYSRLCALTSICLYICFQILYVILTMPLLIIYFINNDCVVFLFFSIIIELIDTD